MLLQEYSRALSAKYHAMPSNLNLNIPRVVHGTALPGIALGAPAPPEGVLDGYSHRPTRAVHRRARVCAGTPMGAVAQSIAAQ